MAELEPLYVAQPGTKNKPSNYNNNFTKMVNYIEATATEVKNYAQAQVGSMSQQVTDLSTTVSGIQTSYIYDTMEYHSAPDEAGNYTVNDGTIVKIEEWDTHDIFYQNVTQTGTTTFYDCGDYWTKKTYKYIEDEEETPVQTLLNVECGGSINCKMQFKTSTQEMFIILPPDVDSSKAVVSCCIADLQDGVSILEPHVPSSNIPNQWSTHRSLWGNDNIGYRTASVIQMHIPKVSSATYYYFTINWNAKINKYETEEE